MRTIREFALAVLETPSLAAKLRPPSKGITDASPRPDRVPDSPARPAELSFVTEPRQKRRVPPIEGCHDRAQLLRILAALANHELQAVELFALALLRFPDAPASFRRGLLRILEEEQLHLSLYLERLEELGGRFGDEPLSGYFWSKAPDLDTPLRFVAAMCLTFESANLDHAKALEEALLACGDDDSAAILARVHDDEIGHVRFGWVWLRRFGPRGADPLRVWQDHLVFPLRPALARGVRLRKESRRAAGLSEDYVALLESLPPEQARYRPQRPSA